MSSKKVDQTKLIITNQRIIDFYNKNTQIDLEKVNLLYIDLFENIINTSIDSPTIVNQIMLSLATQNRDLNNILSVINSSTENHRNELSNIKNIYSLSTDNIKSELDSLKSVVSNLTSFIGNKLYETKDNYVKELKETLRNTDSNTILNISTTVEKNNVLLIDKIMNVLIDIIPKSHNKQYEDIIKVFKDDMINSLDKLKSPDYTIDKISSLVDSKYNNLVFNIQDNMMKYITLSEDRLNSNIMLVKDISNKNSIIQDQINNDLTQYLGKYKTSVNKGTFSENNLFSIIEKEYPSSDLINTSGFTSMGDMVLKRKDCVPILFENKDYTNNVRKDEVDKFIKDVSKNEYNGIFISQHSGIVGRDHFQIDIHNKNILIYIHSCDYDIDKIKLAINTIDTISDKLIDINTDNSTISVEMVKNMNNDYRSFITNRETMINFFKDNHKKTLELFTHSKLPSLEKFLSLHFAETKKNKLLCNSCHKYETDNLKSMARHKHSCIKKIVPENSVELISELVTDSLNDSISENSSEFTNDIDVPINNSSEITNKIKTPKKKKNKDITL